LTDGIVPCSPSRRYQSYAEGRYPIPNDEREREREEWKHDLLKAIFDEKLFLAPIGDHPQKILDLGTGIGLWAVAGLLSLPNPSTPPSLMIETVAEMFPAASVIGVDLSPIQPNYVPPNLEWRIDDLEREWPALFSGADFVYLRSVATTLKNPAKVFESAFRLVAVPPSERLSLAVPANRLAETWNPVGGWRSRTFFQSF
jgi:hypothetical protein